jgi:hypothetical protein
MIYLEDAPAAEAPAADIDAASSHLRNVLKRIAPQPQNSPQNGFRFHNPAAGLS